MALSRSATLRILWGFAILGLGGVAIGLQVDRQADENFAMARKVPAVFRNYALRTLSRNAYASGDNAAGLAYARDLVRRSPLPAENIALVGRGLLVSGETEAAIGALVLSAQRGWRDPWTQSVMIASALEVDDPVTVSQRLLAVMRLKYGYDELGTLIASAISDDAVRSRLVQSIEPDDEWPRDFFRWAIATEIPDDALVEIATNVRDKGARVDCKAMVQSILLRAQGGGASSVNAIWGALCSRGEPTAPDDLVFRRRPGDQGPYDWRIASRGGLDVQGPAESETGIRYEYSGNGYVPLAVRLLALSPGEHVLRIKGSASAYPFVARMQCFDPSGAQVSVDRAIFVEGAAVLSIPQEGCAGQQLSILAGRGTGHIDQVTLDE